MKLGKVIGTVTATRKEEELVGIKFLVVEGRGIDNEPDGALVVAADAVGAGLGEMVLYATGSASRQTKLTHERPVDAVIMAIVDQVAVEGDVTFVKE